MMLSGMSGAPSGGDGISRKLAEAEKLGKRPGASLRGTTPQACERYLLAVKVPTPDLRQSRDIWPVPLLLLAIVG